MASAARALPLPPADLTQLACRRMSPVCPVRGCAKQPPTKEPLACLVPECQPVAGVRGRVGPVSSSPWPQPSPTAGPSSSPAPGPAVPSPLVHVARGQPAQTHPAGPWLPWAACALLLMAAPRCGSSEQAKRAAPEGPGEGGRGGGRGRGRTEVPESRPALPCHSAAAQVCRPGPAQPPVPGGDRPRLVREGELLTPGWGGVGIVGPSLAWRWRGQVEIAFPGSCCSPGVPSL